MKIKSKLYLGFGTVLVLLIMLLAMLMNLLSQLNQNMYSVVKEQYEMVSLTSEIRYELNTLSRESRGLAADPPPELHRQIIQNIQLSRRNITHALVSLENMDLQPKSVQLILDLKPHYEEYTGYVQTAIDLATLEQKSAATEAERRRLSRVLWYDGMHSREQMFKLIDQLMSIEKEGMQRDLANSGDTYELAVKMIYSSILLIIIISIGITLWVVRSITGSLNKVTSVITSVDSSQTDSLPRISICTKDEIAEIAHAYNGMAEILEIQAKQEKELREAAEHESWLKSGVADITTMFTKAEDLKTLAETFTSKVTPMIGASYSVFYLADKTEDQRQLYKLASYAYDEQTVGNTSFSIGSGLVGQCALENKIILLNQVPADYIKISSGLGRATPVSIIILPVAYEGQVLAVIELASLTGFNTQHQTLLQQSILNLGIIMNSITNHMQVERLLEESQTLTEELQTQSEELQQQQEELRTINEKLEEQYEHSEQKTREIELAKQSLEEKAHQLELASNYKSEFLANMSHELRTPLNSLLILAQMLIENTEQNLTAKQIEYARTINSAGNDLLNLINEILDLAKVEAGKMRIIPSEVKLTEVVKLLENQFRPLAQRKELYFEARIDTDVPQTICIDQQRLLQILKNMLSNAIKFTNNGSVVLHIYQVQSSLIKALELDDSGDFSIAISVTDTGIGIPRDKLEIIFKAFLQADGTTSRKYGGTGLGLTISREIAHLLGGQIEVSSIEGKGSVFTLYIPGRLTNSGQLSHAQTDLKPTSQEPTKATVSRGVEGLLEGKKILIVDDDMRNVYSLSAALECYHMEVLFAENGREGLEVLRANPDINLVLMDIMMPELNGYETMRTIRSMPEYNDLPIIALTAKAMKQDRQLCIEAGASDYISKPVNLEQLFSLIRVWLYR